MTASTATASSTRAAAYYDEVANRTDQIATTAYLSADFLQRSPLPTKASTATASSTRAAAYYDDDANRTDRTAAAAFLSAAWTANQRQINNVLVDSGPQRVDSGLYGVDSGPANQLDDDPDQPGPNWTRNLGTYDEDRTAAAAYLRADWTAGNNNQQQNNNQPDDKSRGGGGGAGVASGGRAEARSSAETGEAGGYNNGGRHYPYSNGGDYYPNLCATR
jgi:hypothetical protein